MCPTECDACAVYAEDLEGRSAQYASGNETTRDLTGVDALLGNRSEA
jgi:hypothetical protein